MIEPTTTQAAGAASAASANRAKLAENFDTFLNLLTAQLQNQDPLSPLDSNQFTQQLVQYSQVEQQIETNEQLEALLASNRTAQTGAALGYLGRVAEIDSPVAGSDGSGADWVFTLPAASEGVTLEVRDAAGRLVDRAEVDARAGDNLFAWDGAGAPAGAYTLSVLARDAEGAAQTARIRVAETITAVDLTGSSPQVVTAGGARALDSVLTLREPRS